MIPREDIAVAIFNLLAPLIAGPTPLLKTLSRTIVPAPQMQNGNMPAVFQVQPSAGRVMRDTQTMDNLYAKIIPFEWYIYAQEINGIPASTTLNPILDAVEGVLPTGNNLPFLIDGVPCPIFWDENDVPIMEGVPGISPMSIALFRINAYIPPVVP